MTPAAVAALREKTRLNRAASVRVGQLLAAALEALDRGTIEDVSASLDDAVSEVRGMKARIPRKGKR